MSWRAKSWPIVMSCAVVACATAEDRFDAQESANRAALVEKYPPGSPWSVPSDALGAFDIWVVTEPAPAGFAAFALDRARSRHDGVARCRFGWVPRETRGSSLGAAGVFVDYVFLDSQERVLISYRRFVD